MRRLSARFGIGCFHWYGVGYYLFRLLFEPARKRHRDPAPFGTERCRRFHVRGARGCELRSQLRQPDVALVEILEFAAESLSPGDDVR